MSEEEESKYNFLEIFAILVLAFMIVIPLNFYLSWILLKIIQWYQIPLRLSVLQIFGIVNVIRILQKPEREKLTPFLKLIKKLFSQIAIVSFTLLILYIIHLLIH